MLKEEDLEPDTYGLEFYISAFKELNSCRNGSLDLSPIPFDAIYLYWTVFPTSDFEEFLFLIRLMDDTYRKLESNKAKASEGAKG